MKSNTDNCQALEASPAVNDTETSTEEELLEVGKLSETKGQILGFISDTLGTDFRVR